MSQAQEWWTIWVGDLCVGDLYDSGGGGLLLALKEAATRRCTCPEEAKEAVALLLRIPGDRVDVVDMSDGRGKVVRAIDAQKEWANGG